MIHVPKICFDGGPCGGKTTALAHMVEQLSQKGFYPIVVPEAATLLMNGNIWPAPWPTLEFQTAVIGTAKHLEDVMLRAAKSRSKLKPVLFCDRGKATSKAYVDDVKIYLQALRRNGIRSHVEARDGYQGVIHLTTAANGAEQHYTLANNAARRETIAQARELDDRTRRVWIGAPHWREIDNSTDFAGKLARLEHEIYALLGIPVPIEIERKFLCHYVEANHWPMPHEMILIEQAYLLSSDPAVTSRIRKRGQDGANFLYFRTDKKYLGPGKNEEIERVISAREYATLFATQRDPSKKLIRKTRVCFPYEGQYLEYDMIPIRGGKTLYMLEVELTEENTQVKIPDWIKVIKEVTDDPEYTNVRIAERV
ncbi:hypothetical protein FJY93_01010 [Candidatus Kaiserbacteria bacterium]|nr:hypothetical protein [Candidatus Kaiserbacteria bacterium]